MPSESGWKKPKSAVKLLSAFGVPSVIPGVVPSFVGSVVGAKSIVLERTRNCAPLLTNVVPTSWLFVSTRSGSGVAAPSFGPVGLPFLPVLLNHTPAGNVFASISTM